MKIHTFILLIALAAWGACTSEPDHSEGEHQHEQAEATAHEGEDALHDHHHGSANEFMNQRPFEDLVSSFESEKRTAWQKPEAVIAALGELEGKTVVDIGAGSGYFVFRLAPLVGKVVGVDIDERFLKHMENRKLELKPEMQQRVEIRPTDANTPRLGRGEADIVMIVNTYHHIENRRTYFRQLRSGLKQGGKVVVIDFKEGDLPVGPPADHKISLDIILKELHGAGYSKVEVNSDLLEYQHMVTAY